jgi:protein phosphatase
LNRSVGGAEDVEVPCKLWATVPGDKLLLCTDGLSDCVEPDEMVRCLRYAPALAARRLVDAALAHQARDRRFQDNITALVVEVAA